MFSWKAINKTGAKMKIIDIFIIGVWVIISMPFVLKECNLDCEYQHEGYCIVDLCIKDFNTNDCKAKTNDDLLSYDELEEMGITDW